MSRNKTLCKNERGLIEAVKVRPVLYDKLHKDYRKPLQTDTAWVEVSRAIGEEKIENCKKRWKSLRDTFIKYFRIELMNSVGMSEKKHKVWVFYETMSFLKHHVELFGVNDAMNTSTNADPLSDQDQKPITQNVYEIGFPSDSEAEQVEEIELAEDEMDGQNAQQNQYFIEADDEKMNDLHTAEYVIEKSDEKDHEYEIRRKDSKIHRNDSQTSLQIIPSTFETLNQSSNYVAMDSDEKFLLSCAPALKRLSSKQNAFVRFTIQKLLYDVEFGKDSDEDDNESPKNKKQKC